MESILTSIKKLLGIDAAYTHFDSDIIMHINSVFMTLNQLGVGPSEGFYIEDDTTTWLEYISDLKKLQAVKSYMYLKVKLLFDQATMSSSTASSYERMISEYEWRLNVDAESEGGKPAAPTIDPTHKIIYVSLPAKSWIQDGSNYYQVISGASITMFSKVDLTPSPAQLESLIKNGLSLTTVNNNGVLRVISIGSVPTEDYTIQALVVETDHNRIT